MPASGLNKVGQRCAAGPSVKTMLSAVYALGRDHAIKSLLVAIDQ